MQAPPSIRGPVKASLVALVALLAGCHAEAKINASTDESRSEAPESEPAPSAPASASVTAAAPAAPSAPPADACPLTCFEARGSERVELTAEEITQLRTALEPTIGKMRSCSSPEDWRRYGSATVNLRLAPDGTLAELGVDPHHANQSSCFDDAGRGATASVSLPGRKVVRCAEHCARPASPSPGLRRGGRRGR
jgi:hypothetical protein